MRPELFIARRLRLREKGSRRSAISVTVSTVGVALSMVIMLLTIAIVAGFKSQITAKIFGFDAQVTISTASTSFTREEPVEISPAVEDLISTVVSWADVDHAVVQPAMLKTDDDFSAVVFRGYDTGKDWSFIEENLVADAAGSSRPAMPDLAADSLANAIVISQLTANALRLSAGDNVNVCFFIDGKMRLRKMTVAAIFNSNFTEYDKIVAFAPVTTLRSLQGLADDQASRIEISGLDRRIIGDTRDILDRCLLAKYYGGSIPAPLRVDSVLQTGAQYFNWLDLLDTNVVVVIILMSAISVFTLMASLFILILERVSLIGTLKTLGATNGLIRRVFIIMVSRILLRGLLWGNALGLLLIFLQWRFRLMPLDPQAYFISYVPVEIGWLPVVVINAAAIIIALTMMIVPSMVISRMSAASTVRYE